VVSYFYSSLEVNKNIEEEQSIKKGTLQSNNKMYVACEGGANDRCDFNGTARFKKCKQLFEY